MVILIRHAEKPQDEYMPFGVKESGERSEHSLTPRGWQRAGALTCMFNHEEIGVPQLIYAANPRADGTGDRSHRAVQTVTPLAFKLGVPVISKYSVGDELLVAQDIQRHLEQTVLVCWEHKKLPIIAQALCPQAPAEWPDKRFDVMWVIYNNQSFQQYNQSLLAGDL